MYSTNENCSMSATPAKMNPARSTSAPNTPQNSTRNWYSAGTTKNVRITAHTKTLSTLRLSSSR